MTARVIVEAGDERVIGQRALDQRTLHATAPAVDDAHLGKAAIVRRLEVGIEDVSGVPGSEGVKVELRLDGHLVRRVVAGSVGHGCGVVGEAAAAAVEALYSAVIVERMPPRGVKAPVTVICFGWHERTRSSRISLVTAS